jgi:putative ABC transport system substrate-binding protein
MRRKGWLALFGALTLAGGCQKHVERLFTFGVFQITDSPTLTECRKSFVEALGEAGLRDGVNIRLEVRNAMGDVNEAQRIAQQFVRERVDEIIALSTPCLQAAMMATPKVPIIFSSVADPELLGVGSSGPRRFRNVTGVSSMGPVRQMMALIREVMPQAKRIGTLWTPAELNSEYYLRVARESAAELGFEIIAVPVISGNEVLFAAQTLLNQKIDALFPISDNTINAAFEVVGRVAQENAIPLFAAILVGARLGACAAMGWDFAEMGQKTAEIALRVKNGEEPDRIPIESMKRLRLFLNLGAAAKEGIEFPPAVIDRADELVSGEGSAEKQTGDQ